MFTQTPYFFCFSHAGLRKFAVGPPTSWMYPLKSGSDARSFASSTQLSTERLRTALDGTLHIDSVPGKGTKVTITIPRTKEAAE